MDQIDKDKIIALQRQKIEDLSIKVNALEQEVALLHHEIKQQKKAKKSPTL
jgi:outer membrane murein-binding lipoprotein Lpp